MAREKDPRRVAAALRTALRTRRRDFWWIALFWILPLIGLAACWRYEAPTWLWVLAWIALVSGLIQFFADLSQYRGWKDRLRAAETRIDEPPDLHDPREA